MKNIFIYQDISIKQSLKKFNEIGEKVLIVVDEDNALLGTITDGDIRRHILDTGTLEGTITDLYNKNPKFIYVGDSHEKAKYIMLENKIEVLPVINYNKKVIGYISWTDLFENNIEFYHAEEKIEIPIFIMAGGKGTRLKPFTKIFPKALLPVKDKTITEHIIDSFKKFGFYKFILILNYKGKLIESYFNSFEKDYIIDFLVEEDFYGTAGSLSLIKKFDVEDFFVSNCDVLLRVDYLDVLKKHKIQNSSFTLITSIKNYHIPYGVVNTTNKNFVTSINEKPEMFFQVNTGVYLINKEILNYISNNSYLDMPVLINEAIKRRKNILAYPINQDNYLDFGEWNEYKNALE